MSALSCPAVAPLTERRLQARLAGAQVRGRLPSVVAGVLRDGELVWTGSHGDHRAPGAPAAHPLDVQHRIGSITKTMTAVLVLQLVRDGAVSLDEPAATWLGDAAYASHSVRSLLAHSSGMRSEPVGSWWERSAGMSWEELSQAHTGAQDVFPAAHRFHYSNLGYALLGEVVARASGTAWWQCVQERLLAPLGMDRTSYLPTGAAAQGYSVDPYARTLVPEPATDTGAMAPAGQVWSTLRDLATWNAFLLDGHPDVLELAHLLEASHPQAGDKDQGLTGAQGLGFQLHAGGSGTLVGHTGSMPGFRAGCFVDRPRRTGAVLLANATTGVAPAGLLADLLDELERSEPTVPAAWTPTTSVPPQLRDVLGVWHWGNTPVVLTLEGEELVATEDGDASDAFGVVDGRILGLRGYHAGEELRVVRRADGSLSHLEVATFVWTRTPYDPDAPVPGGHPGRG